MELIVGNGESIGGKEGTLATHSFGDRFASLVGLSHAQRQNRAERKELSAELDEDDEEQLARPLSYLAITTSPASPERKEMRGAIGELFSVRGKAALALALNQSTSEAAQQLKNVRAGIDACYGSEIRASDAQYKRDGFYYAQRQLYSSGAVVLKELLERFNVIRRRDPDLKEVRERLLHFAKEHGITAVAGVAMNGATLGGLICELMNHESYPRRFEGVTIIPTKRLKAPDYQHLINKGSPMASELSASIEPNGRLLIVDDVLTSNSGTRRLLEREYSAYRPIFLAGTRYEGSAGADIGFMKLLFGT